MCCVKCLINFIGLNDMNNFLDKIAMEVAEWAETPSDRKTWCWAHSNEYDDFIAYLDKDNVVTKDQWLQRRKELINEPCDNDAPEWAKWKAQDSSGFWYWYRGYKPRACRDQWAIACVGDVGVANKGETPAGHDWRKTLKGVERKAKVYDSFYEAVKGVSVSGFLKNTNQNQLSDLCFLLDTTQDEWVKEVIRIAIARLLCRQYSLDINEIIKPVVQ